MLERRKRITALMILTRCQTSTDLAARPKLYYDLNLVRQSAIFVLGFTITKFS